MNWRSLRSWWVTVAGITGAALTAMICGWFGLSWSASSAAWWTGDTPGWPALVRASTRWLGGEVALAVIAGTLGTALLVGLTAAAWRVRGPVAAGVALALLLAWPDARALLSTVSAESVLALTLLLLLHATWQLHDRPRWGGVLLALAVAVGLGSHPLSLPMMPVLLVLPLAWPSTEASDDAAVGPRPRPVLLAWLAGVCFGFGIVLVAAQAGGWKHAWSLDLASLRTPQSALQIGGAASLPGIGPLATWLGRTPALLALLTLGVALRPWRRPSAEGPAVALLMLWLLALAWTGQPLPGHLDGVRLLAPVVVLLASTATVDLGTAVIQRRRLAVALGALAVCVLVSDLALLAAGDGRSSMGRLPGVLSDAGPTRPAELDRDAMALLARYRAPTALLPARAGGLALGAALPLLEPGLRGVYFGPAYASQLVLIERPTWHPIDSAWSAIGQSLGCAGRFCLVRRAGPEPSR